MAAWNTIRFQSSKVAKLAENHYVRSRVPKAQKATYIQHTKVWCWNLKSMPFSYWLKHVRKAYEKHLDSMLWLSHLWVTWGSAIFVHSPILSRQTGGMTWLCSMKCSISRKLHLGDNWTTFEHHLQGSTSHYVSTAHWWSRLSYTHHCSGSRCPMLPTKSTWTWQATQSATLRSSVNNPAFLQWKAKGRSFEGQVESILPTNSTVLN